MTDEHDNALVHRPSTDLVGSERRTSPVIARMTQDMLARAQAGGLSRARFRIGDYLLREPDYRQILCWAEALSVTPQTVLAVLAETRVGQWGQNYEPITFALEDGAIVSLAWDFDRLPVIPKPWLPGLLIGALGFRGKWPDVGTALRPVLPRLQTLICTGIGLGSVDLSHVSGLNKLDCGINLLSDLDLSPVPKLTKLSCSSNQLTDLDLSPAPGLIMLYCWNNRLTELNLLPESELTDLACGGNPLAMLDLSPVPQLTRLHCWRNKLTRLDLSPVPLLTQLGCGSNLLTELDLSPVPGLNRLDCRFNQLTELDIMPVPGLTHLNCDASVRLLNPPAHLRVEREQRQ